MTLNFDDVAVNDSTGADQNTWPGEGSVVLLVPTADSAKGTGWTNDAASSTSLFPSVDNLPPVGIADTTGSTGAHQIRNATSNANSNYDATLTTYTAAGVGASDTVNVLVPIVATAAPLVTSAKQGTVGVSSNPVIANIALGAGGTAGAFWSGLAGGTYPTGWKWSRGTTTYAPTVTLGTAPVMRITQVTASTRIAVVCAMGMYVEYVPASGPSLTTVTGVGSIATAQDFGTPTKSPQIAWGQGIASAQTFGAAQATRILKPVGIATAQAFGRPTLSIVAGGFTVSGVGAIATAQAFGTSKLVRNVGPTGTTSGEAFGTTRVVRVVRPSAGIASAEASGAPAVRRVATAISITSAETFGTTHLTRLLYPLGVTSAGAFGTTRVLSPQYISIAGKIATAEAFGQADRVIRILSPVAIASAQAFGTATVRRIIGAIAIASSETFGTSKIIRIVGPTGVASSEAFGRPTLAQGVRFLSAVGAIPSSETFGAPRARFVVATLSVASSQAFGTTSVLSPQYLSGVGAISTAQAFGVTHIQFILRPVALASAETLGQPRLRRVLAATAITTTEAFGTTKLIRVVRNVGSISSSEAFGRPTASLGIYFVSAAGAIPSRETFGSNRVRFVIGAIGVTSAQAFGIATVIGGAQPYSITAAGRIASAETFGLTTHILFVLRGTGIVSAQAIGIPSLPRLLQRVGAIGSAQTFGTARVGYIVGTLGITSREAFGTTRLLSPQYIFVYQGIGSSEAWGTPEVFDATIRAASAYGGVLLSDVAVYAILIIDTAMFGLHGNVTQVYGEDIGDTQVYDEHVAAIPVYAGSVDTTPRG